MQRQVTCAPNLSQGLSLGCDVIIIIILSCYNQYFHINTMSHDYTNLMTSNLTEQKNKKKKTATRLGLEPFDLT